MPSGNHRRVAVRCRGTRYRVGGAMLVRTSPPAAVTATNRVGPLAKLGTLTPGVAIGASDAADSGRPGPVQAVSCQSGKNDPSWRAHPEGTGMRSKRMNRPGTSVRLCGVVESTENPFGRRPPDMIQSTARRSRHRALTDSGNPHRRLQVRRLVPPRFGGLIGHSFLLMDPVARQVDQSAPTTWLGDGGNLCRL